MLYGVDSSSASRDMPVVNAMRQCKGWSTNQYQAARRIRPTVHIYMGHLSWGILLVTSKVLYLAMIFQYCSCMSEQFVSVSVSSTVFTRNYCIIILSIHERQDMELPVCFRSKAEIRISQSFTFSKQKTPCSFRMIFFSPYCTHVLALGRRSILCWFHHFSYRWRPSFGA